MFSIFQEPYRRTEHIQRGKDLIIQKYQTAENWNNICTYMHTYVCK
jgi:hypothetical protein